MSSPTGLTIKTDIASMEIGDCIPCRYTATSGAVGTFSEFGTSIATEIPTTGIAIPDGLFYFIKADKGLLIADRVVQHSISWDTLNAGRYIEGIQYTTDMPKMTSNTTPSPYVISASNEYNPAYLAFDGTKGVYSSGWVHYTANPVDTTYPAWLQIDTGTPKLLKSYSIYPRNDGVFDYHPKDFKMQGSSDGNTWVDLDTRTGYTSYTTGSFSTLTISNPTTKYRYYRLYVTALQLVDAKFVQITEFAMSFSNDNMLIRSLSGGCAYSDASGNLSITDQSKGCFPTINEWDTYIVNSDLKGKITKGLDSIWHWASLYSFGKDTPVTGISASTTRTSRGNVSSLGFNNPSSSASSVTQGFRPVLEYKEDGTSIWG